MHTVTSLVVHEGCHVEGCEPNDKRNDHCNVQLGKRALIEQSSANNVHGVPPHEASTLGMWESEV
jgi:hypothetical protein